MRRDNEGKGKRLIIVHIGSEEGFLKEGLLKFQSFNTGDYQEDMNSNVFENYFDNLIKKELLAIENLRKQSFMKYAVEDIAEKHSVTVLCTPPYHCELNPIELIWAQVKGFEVTPENWRKPVHHVIKEEEKMWDLDHLIDRTVDPLIITSRDDTSSDDEEYCDFL
ncbi:hypothetical protein NQ317_004078 [Molorchus minor]|uniref:Tc1-like transposase DDE domain-containing protein n=1 Tax=Molorchus minor TaxID=1323400 RepID=A0ABQ9JAP9_9CUCU|nr:hypothetical protein NQ317_004078 [Molorchus minor]